MFLQVFAGSKEVPDSETEQAESACFQEMVPGSEQPLTYGPSARYPAKLLTVFVKEIQAPVDWSIWTQNREEKSLHREIMQRIFPKPFG